MMPDNPEFTAAQVFDAAKVYVKDHPTAAAMLRALATRLQVEEQLRHYPDGGAPGGGPLKPAHDAGTGPRPKLIGLTEQQRDDIEFLLGRYYNPSLRIRVMDLIRWGQEAISAVDAGTGEARIDCATTLTCLLPNGHEGPHFYQPSAPQPPAPVPDLAELLSDEAVYQIALNAPDDLPDEGWAPNVQPLKASIIALLTPWLVSREAASRRRIEELRSDTKRLSDDACANWRKAHAAELALAQLRREAQALVDKLAEVEKATLWMFARNPTAYNGPTYAAEIEAVRATLARLPVDGGNQ